MANTVYENKFQGVDVAFTRFWAGDKDGVQITLNNRVDVLYVQMTLDEFRKAVELIEKNVEETKDAWWHHLGKKEGA